MGLNYKKRIKVAPGVHVNVGKKSAGISIGGKYGGVSMNSRTGTTVHTSAPGTGLSYREHISSSNSKAHAAKQTVRQEQIRRADKKTAAKSKKEKAPKPKKESKLSTLEPEKKAKVNKISVLGIAAGIVLGVVCAALQAENIAILFGALLIVSLYIFAKTK